MWRSGKSESITITNNKDRFTKEEIERLVAEGEQFAADDEVHRKRVETLNNLSTLLYNLKRQVSDKSSLGGKLDDYEKQTILDAVKEGIEWVEANGQDASLDEVEEKLAGTHSSVCLDVVTLTTLVSLFQSWKVR